MTTTKKDFDTERLHPLMDRIISLYSGAPQIESLYGPGGAASTRYRKSILFLDELSASLWDPHRRNELVLSPELQKTVADYDSHSIEIPIIFGKVEPKSAHKSFQRCDL